MRRHKQPKAKIVASPLLATRMQMFQHRYWKARERAKNDPDPQVLIDFDSKEFFQTTRREPDPKGGERLLPNQEDLFAGVLGEERIRVPRGAYPPNTAGAEHSHPKKGNQSDYVTSTVSLGDLRSSFEELTNENHYAGTKMEFAQMYDPRSNRGFAYNGVLMEDCYPIYFEVVIPDHLKINVPEDYDMSQGLHIPGTAPDSPKLTPTNVPKHWPGPEYQPSLNPGAAQS